MSYHLVLPFLLFVVLFAGLAPVFLHAEQKPPGLLLANVYRSDINLVDYWVSEKLDGVRAYWTGDGFLSRQGNVIEAPAWFIKGFPNVSLDGELWMGRGTFEELSGAVRRQSPDNQQWRKIRFMVFDLPGEKGDYDQRLVTLRGVLNNIGSAFISVVEQYKVPNRDALQANLEQVVRQGGEGLMLHRGSSNYLAARSDDLLKLKTREDAEAVVVAHLPGKGKYKDMMGALLVETPSGLRFKLGTGFSDAERANPPAIGSTVTYKYSGKTERGVPRFAVFLRVAEDVSSP